jgi:hypothetical protein
MRRSDGGLRRRRRSDGLGAILVEDSRIILAKPVTDPDPDPVTDPDPDPDPVTDPDPDPDPVTDPVPVPDPVTDPVPVPVPVPISVAVGAVTFPTRAPSRPSRSTTTPPREPPRRRERSPRVVQLR